MIPHTRNALRRSKRALRSALLAWFAQAKRDLPWRRTRDPYAIWISEVMLQQTQVVTVIPYWERFLERFPAVQNLAETPLTEVLSLWSGLGYYSRARNLHRAAQQIVLQGGFPKTAEGLKELPGFGPYTAGAVASIAFEEEAPLVDGNVARVFSRLFLVEGLPGDRAREKKLWELAAEWVRGPQPGDWNQALMELGATVCRADLPNCSQCPLQIQCQAKAAGRETQLPPPKVRAARKLLNLAVAVMEQDGALLLGRRQENGLFGGLWELPSIPYPTRDRELPKAFSDMLGMETSVVAPLATVRRTLTHRDLELHLFKVTGRGVPRLAQATYLESQWALPSAFAQLGLSSAMEEALTLAVRPI